MWKKEYRDGGGGGKHCSLRENCRIWNVAGFVGLNTPWVHLIFTQSIFIQNLQCTRLCTNFRGGLYHSLEPQHWYQVLAPKSVQKQNFMEFYTVRQKKKKKIKKSAIITLGFLGGSVVKNLPANAGDAGSTTGSGRSLGEGNGNPNQYSCLGNSMDRGAWRTTVHGVARVGHNLVTKHQLLIHPGTTQAQQLQIWDHLKEREERDRLMDKYYWKLYFPNPPGRSMKVATMS